jgi:hypothetical protein
MDQWCDPDVDVCVPYHDVGDTCDYNAPCPPYAVCGEDDTCTVKAVEGEECQYSWDCLADLDCEEGRCVPPPNNPACDLP